jgi:hypothetical protein
MCTTCLTLSNSTFCPHSVFMCCCVDLRTNSDYFPIQHQVTGLYNRDGMCLLRGTDWVINIIQVNLSLWTTVSWLRRSVAGLSLRKLSFDVIPVRMRFLLVTVALEPLFSQSCCFPCQYHSTNAPHSSSSTCCSYQRDKRANPGNLTKRQYLSESGSVS